MLGTQLIIQAANVVVGLFTVMIFFVIHIICGTENDVVVNVTFINMSGKRYKKFPLSTACWQAPHRSDVFLIRYLSRSESLYQMKGFVGSA